MVKDCITKITGGTDSVCVVEGRNKYKILVRKTRREGSRCGGEDRIKIYFKDNRV